ncbi:asparaginase [Amycolatopsis sp. H20-H5]|uniref:asparaginase n=1 Tax=Amycolatopsis sp. H20-H5 TaxID=3046309 RepID=UPI002DC05790|nr:asparaginase [Amycolatopsis sp. H20-H5]MEC3977024.1 asparaginase [Amycolatopsis sp. H20-H5]
MTVNPELVQVVRSGFVESTHRGSLVITRPDGTVQLALGAVDRPVFTRSSSKPLQATGMLRAGLEVDDEDLAFACASHNGEPGHVARAVAMLAAAGLDESALVCPPDNPLHEGSRVPGEQPRRAAMNCSGKHSAMLMTCVQRGWATQGYEQPDHPLQQVIAETITALTGESVAATGVDGCGAPLLAFSLTGLARAFSRLVVGADSRVADAMRRSPWLVAGTGREDTVLMRAVPGLLIKGGAEGVHAFCLADGTAFALKVDDGAQRARLPLLLAALGYLGVGGGPEVAGLPANVVLGGGHPVGTYRVVAPL